MADPRGRRERRRQPRRREDRGVAQEEQGHHDLWHVRFDGPYNHGDAAQLIKQVQNKEWKVVWPTEFAAPGRQADRLVSGGMPSATLLGQALISGVLAGGLYGLLAMGLSLSWGLLRLVNLSHFALAFLAAYLVYELGTTYHVEPWWSAAMIVPAMFAIGVGPALAVRQVQGQRARLAADHLQLRGDPRGRHPALLDRRLPPLRDRVLRRARSRPGRSTSRCSS